MKKVTLVLILMTVIMFTSCTNQTNTTTITTTDSTTIEIVDSLEMSLDSIQELPMDSIINESLIEVL